MAGSFSSSQSLRPQIFFSFSNTRRSCSSSLSYWAIMCLTSIRTLSGQLLGLVLQLLEVSQGSLLYCSLAVGAMVERAKQEAAEGDVWVPLYQPNAAYTEGGPVAVQEPREIPTLSQLFGPVSPVSTKAYHV